MVWACGWNADSQLGDGTTTRRGHWAVVPHTPAGLAKVVSKADTSFALTGAT